MSESPEIDIPAAERLLAAGAQLIDVRRQEEWDGARLSGARHIPMDELTARAGEIDPGEPVIFYCHGGTRSAMAAQAFRAGGYEAFTLTGGIRAWDDAGRELEPPGAPIVH